MRDIRQDLRERLASVRAKRDAMQQALRQLSEQEATIQKLLDAEGSIWEQINPPLFESTGEKPQSTPLSQVLLDTLKSKNGTASLDELKDAAVRRGVPFGDKQPGRVIHFAMLGMAQHSLVERTTDGKWELKESAVN